MATVIEERIDARDDVTVVDYRRRTSVARVIVGAAGVALLVLGIVALLRTGLPDFSGEQVEATVGWFHRTGWMGLIEIVLGAALLSSASNAFEVRGARGVGVVGAIFGLILLIEPDVFHGALGVHADTGLTYLLGGIVLALAGSLAAYPIARWR